MKHQTRSSGRNLWLTITFLIGAAAVLVACSTTAPPTPATVVDCPTVATLEPVTFNELWESSPHADEQAEAFRHWDADNPQEIPVVCAMCHSRTGFLDFLGVDGTSVDVVDNPVKIGTVVTCYVCHNEATYALDSVTFSSGSRIGSLGPEAICITCHQGRASTQMLNIKIREVNLTSDDTPSVDLKFLNSHSTSGATPFGSEAHGAYEYDGESYHERFYRGTDFFACTRCHDQHSLEVKIETCSNCHTFDGVEVKNIRVNTTDVDGDGDVAEGIAFEIDQIHQDLYIAIQAYARNAVGVPIVYDFTNHPYFFIDTNGNGLPDPEEVTPENAYNNFSPRLLRATYNYNYVSHDAGAFAHNSTYIAQVLYDSLADIGGDVSGKMRP